MSYTLATFGKNSTAINVFFDSIHSFRSINVRNLGRINAFKDVRGDIILLDSIYIDSTFLSSEYPNFPSQTQSNEQILKLTEDWLSMNQQNVVVLRPPANYGYEYLFGFLSEKLHQKIHIFKDTIKDYRCFPDLRGSVTDSIERENVRIHCCPSTNGDWKSLSLRCCPGLSAEFIKIIRPTAFRWNEWNESEKIHHEIDKNLSFVCYSNHASFNEIKELINYLKPKRIEFNVLPVETKAANEVKSLIGEQIKDQAENFPSEMKFGGFKNILSRLENSKFVEEKKDEEKLLQYSIKRRKKT